MTTFLCTFWDLRTHTKDIYITCLYVPFTWSLVFQQTTNFPFLIFTRCFGFLHAVLDFYTLFLIFTRYFWFLHAVLDFYTLFLIFTRCFWFLHTVFDFYTLFLIFTRCFCLKSRLQQWDVFVCNLTWTHHLLKVVLNE